MNFELKLLWLAQDFSGNFSGTSKYLQTFIPIRPAALKGGLPLGEINGDFAAKFIWTYALLFVYSLAGEIFLLTIVKMNLTISRPKKSPQYFDQLKDKYKPIFALSANTFQSDQIQDGGYTMSNVQLSPDVLSTLILLQQGNLYKV